MAAVGIDPIFAKAYRLLFSNEPDSAEQMRAMLDEALKQKYGTHKTLSSVLPKKLMVEESGSKDVPQSPSAADVEDMDSEESNNSHDNDLNELNILEEDLSCVVCREIVQMESNRLVECQDCHSLYHQECHQPVISETEIPVNDPRLAWYCASCKKNMNKAISNIKINKPSAVPPPVTSKPSPPVGGKPPFSSSKSFTSPKSAGGTSKSSSAVTKSSATAGPSSSGSSNSGTSTKTVKPSGSSKAPIQNINMISADKRLQMMKKKAAAANKNQDKKK